MSRRTLIACALVGVGGLACWLVWPSPSDSPVVSDGTTHTAPPSGPQQTSIVRPDSEPATTTPTVAPSPGPPHPLAPVFPNKAHHVCPAPEDIAEGRYTAGEADVLVRDGQTIIWSAVDPGGEPARWLGRWLGDVSWESGHCEWHVPSLVEVTFEVIDGGIHTIAGCPVGEAVETNEDGVVTVQVPQNHTCAARVVGGREGLQMGPRVAVSPTEPMTVELDTALEPLSDDEIDQGLALLQRMAVFHVEQAQAELDRVTRLGSGLTEAEWVIEAARERVAFMEGERERVESPATELDVLRDFLLSQTN